MLALPPLKTRCKVARFYSKISMGAKDFGK